MSQFHTYLAGIVLAAAVAGGAQAQPLSTPQNFGVRTMSFDLWCQQTQRYPAERCKERRAEDVKAFEDYRTVVERYELEYLKQVQKERESRSFTTRDPSQSIFDRQEGLGGGGAFGGGVGGRP